MWNMNKISRNLLISSFSGKKACSFMVFSNILMCSLSVSIPGEQDYRKGQELTHFIYTSVCSTWRFATCKNFTN